MTLKSEPTYFVDDTSARQNNVRTRRIRNGQYPPNVTQSTLLWLISVITTEWILVPSQTTIRIFKYSPEGRTQINY
ncbi:hypothetical protein VNO78_31539 [Psophocarpus tetragonolobus]|uniref:Uncharacterized protein n=1 Tax=Psophocarpus tetragonolobus TaxID=3891 RepID=A0AAN9X7C0_PSOTE